LYFKYSQYGQPILMIFGRRYVQILFANCNYYFQPDRFCIAYLQFTIKVMLCYFGNYLVFVSRLPWKLSPVFYCAI